MIDSIILIALLWNETQTQELPVYREDTMQEITEQQLIDILECWDSNHPTILLTFESYCIDLNTGDRI